MKIFYFTATGNSLEAAKALKDAYGAELISIPQELDKPLGSRQYVDEVIGFVYPTYFSNAPEPVIEFIKSATFKADYAFAINTFGISAAASTALIPDAAKGSGLNLDYLNSIKGVETFVNMFDIEKMDIKFNQIRHDEKLADIVKDIGEHRHKVHTGGPLAQGVARVLRSAAKKQIYGPGTDLFVDGDACIGCGTCVNVCPRNNIKLIDEKAVIGPRCISCMACVHACPTGAIHGKNEKSTYRFRNPNVSVLEIEEANSRLK